MFKYRNISDFRQSLVLKGKRILIKPDDVIESDTELKYVFLEQVDVTTPVTQISSSSVVRKVDDLEQKISTLEKEKEEMIASQSKEIYDTVEEIDKAVKDLQAKIGEVTGVLAGFKKAMDAISTQVNTLTTETSKDKALIMKRLEMVKTAVMTIEEEVFGGNENLQGK
jgi:tetrahydromethanopterin S-methyltransferase subunit B